jgi:hypothetical protein
MERQMLIVKQRRITAIRSAVLALSVAILAVPVVASANGGACDDATAAAAQACGLQTKADYALRLGVCVQARTKAKQEACTADATQQAKDDRSLCQAQKQERTFVCQGVGQAPYSPSITRARFPNPTTINNLYLPMAPGTTYTYSIPGGKDVVSITRETRVIDGIETVVVRDVSTVDGKPEENTIDFFAQDKDGNVWYFGEQAQQFTDGRVTGVDGSWLGGVDGAQPGIAMLADPTLGKTYRQEFSLGEAEDSASVFALNQTVTTPLGTYQKVLQTSEFSGLEPGPGEFKFYATGVGPVKIVDLATGEINYLVSVTTGN